MDCSAHGQRSISYIISTCDCYFINLSNVKEDDAFCENNARVNKNDPFFLIASTK